MRQLPRVVDDYSQDKDSNVRTLRVQVSNLRLKLLPYGLNITTMVNVGYRIARSDDDAAS
jgi:DNA-binding response OmpR family regulator